MPRFLVTLSRVFVTGYQRDREIRHGEIDGSPSAIALGIGDSENGDDGDEIAQDRRDRSSESEVEVNVGRTTTAVASSTKVPKASSRGESPPACRSVEYFHERVGREREARTEVKQKEI
ncbi:hypothetical protein G5I_05195 [Acromyrmex echinatior]|uniref:Uncharacterized protein n=1 Tax=Acromyrmex echinatior TaxID=103372 RepID=F4WHM8_ACREC|nr:hypothetical protein G5I_05195 [Acromyrmex echinatior]